MNEQPPRSIVTTPLQAEGNIHSPCDTESSTGLGVVFHSTDPIDYHGLRGWERLPTCLHRKVDFSIASLMDFGSLVSWTFSKKGATLVLPK